MGVFDSDEQFSALHSLLLSSRNTFAFNKKIMEKEIDISWVEAIESAMPHIDNVLRNPRKTIEDVEEVVPIALSKKITVESIKHLGQHTDYIQSVDPKTGKITPSKILNVHKEESLMTYENKFVNTLVDRLYIFLNRRYEKLTQVAKDEEVYSLSYDTALDDSAGRKMNISLKIETVDSLETANDKGLTVWDRVEKIKKAIEGYKGSILCTTLGNTFIRPPVMRTNAIMKNVDLKACLILWQYIESYDKAGYEINISNTAEKPDPDYIEDVYKLAVLNFLLFRSYTKDDAKAVSELKTQKTKTIAPRILKKFDKEDSRKYDSVFQEDLPEETVASSKKTPENVGEIAAEINRIIEIERQYLEDEEQRRIAEQKAFEEAEKKRLAEEERQRELERIEKAKQEERERIRREKEEQERERQRLLEEKRAEQEAREREERERLAEQQRQAELERIKREEEERIQAEKERIREDKKTIRTELGTAVEGFSETVQQDDNVMEFEASEVAARKAKEEQQRREQERRETERANRLRAERARIESKDVSEIYREYSKNPYHVVRRGIRDFLSNAFGIIPKDTDNPDLIKKLAERDELNRKREEERASENELRTLFEKYSPTFGYRFKRSIKNAKFKRKKRKEAKQNPKPKYVPVNRTPEEEKALNDQMKQLYKKYHVNFVMKLRRYVEEKRLEMRMK